MRDTISTLESEPALRQANDMNEAVETIRGKKVRFAYASGAKPLAGYTIKRGIGVGGFGEVYFAISDAGKEVALKRIQRNLDIELRGVRQCLNLKHVNLIALWDICTTEAGESWVVMEYVPGDSLRDAIERSPQGMPLPEVHRWFRSAAAGVNYLHNNGIVHRDLKPGNIFYDADEDVVKIGDYGLSKFISCSRRSGQTESVGTFHYMAPEIGKGVYGKEIDIYALGVMLYEMLTGKLPFDGETSQEIIMKHLTADPNVDPIPVEFRRAITRSLAKDPDERYHSIDELLGDFPPINVPYLASMPSASNGAEKTLKSNPQALRNAPAASTPMVSLMQVPGASNPAFDKDTIYIGDDDGIQFQGAPQIVDAQAVGGAPINPIQIGILGAGEEPIARAVKSTYRSLVDQWNRSKLGTGTKTFLLIVAATILVTNSTWLLPLGLVVGLIYLPYLAIRSWVVVTEPPAPKPPKPVPAPKRMRVSRRDLDLHMRQSLIGRPVGQRLGDLTGSMLASAIASSVFGLLIGAFFTRQSAVSAWSYGVWVALTAIVASWGILVCGKLWETSSGENLVRRFWMTAMGVMVGLISFGVGRALEMDFSGLAVPSENSILEKEFATRLLDNNGQPTLALFLLYFGGTFGILRWWRQADPTRKTRLSIWSACLSWLAALLLAEVFGFPQIAGCLAVVSAAVATQLAAPWINQNQRKQIRQAAMSNV